MLIYSKGLEFEIKKKENIFKVYKDGNFIGNIFEVPGGYGLRSNSVVSYRTLQDVLCVYAGLLSKSDWYFIEGEDTLTFYYKTILTVIHMILPRGEQEEYEEEFTDEWIVDGNTFTSIFDLIKFLLEKYEIEYNICG